MKRTKLLQHLHSYGCRFKREGANHTIYTDAGGTRQTAIPRHAEIKLADSGSNRAMLSEGS
jgi:hypothetical protein